MVFLKMARTSTVKALLIKVKSLYAPVTFLRKIKRVLLKFRLCNDRRKKEEAKLCYIETNIIMYDSQRKRSRINVENLKHDGEVDEATGKRMRKFSSKDAKD